jgi:L-malate glycosyltransferase
MLRDVKTICLVTPEFLPARYGGLARTAAKVADHLASLGLSVHVVHAMPVDGLPPLLDENRKTWRRGEVLVHDVALGREAFPDGNRSLWDCPHTLTLVMLAESLEILHREHSFDAFLSFFLYPIGYVTGLVARKSDVPHVACVVGNDVKKYVFSPEKTATCKSGLDNADRVVFLSHDLMAWADALTPVRDKARIIHNSVEIPAASWTEPAQVGTFNLGCAAIFKHAKGLPYLLKALATLGQTGAVTLSLAGEARPEEQPLCETLLDRTGVRDRVTFSGVIPHDGMNDWLAGLDAFVLPSVSEGCPNVLMEAMAMGLPCVATRVGAAEALIDDGVSGLLVPWGDTAALAQTLARLRADPGLAASLGREARKRMADFSPAREKAQWGRVMREVVDFPWTPDV